MSECIICNENVELDFLKCENCVSEMERRQQIEKEIKFLESILKTDAEFINRTIEERIESKKKELVENESDEVQEDARKEE